MTTEKTSIIVIESKLPSFKADIEGEKIRLKAELEKYKNVLVTEETLATDKKLGQTLKAQGKEYKTTCKAKVDEVSAPIVEFKTDMNELVELCNDTAKLITDQVAVFEKKKLELIKAALVDYITEKREAAEIDSDHITKGNPEDKSIKLGSFTAKGELTKGAKDAVDAIVALETSNQNRTQFRLLQLENESHKAGLNSPLVRVNVELFLFSDDETYDAGLKRIVESELERQQQAEQKIRDNLAAEQKIKDAAEAEALADSQLKAEQTPAEEYQQENVITTPENVRDQLDKRFGGQVDDFHAGTPQMTHDNEKLQGVHIHQGNVNEPEIINHDHASLPNEPQYDPAYEQYQHHESQDHRQTTQQVDAGQAAVKAAGNMACTVTATFKVSVPVTTTANQITDKIRSMLESAGIKILHSLEVSKDA